MSTILCVVHDYSVSLMLGHGIHTARKHTGKFNLTGREKQKAFAFFGSLQ